MRFLFAAILITFLMQGLVFSEEIILSTILPASDNRISTPDFDSGWIEAPAQSSAKTLSFATDNALGTRNISGKDPGKFLVSINYDYGNYDYAQYLTNFCDGSSYGYAGIFMGMWYNNLTSTGMRIVRGSGQGQGSTPLKIRVYIWCWE